MKISHKTSKSGSNGRLRLQKCSQYSNQSLKSAANTLPRAYLSPPPPTSDFTPQSSAHPSSFDRNEPINRDHSAQTANAPLHFANPSNPELLKLPKFCIRQIQKAKFKPALAEKLLWLCDELYAIGGTSEDGAPVNSHYFQRRISMRGKDLLEHLIRHRIIELVRAHKIKISCARYRFCQEGNCLNPVYYKMQNKSLIKKRGDTESYAKARLAGARLPMVILENLKAIKPNADFGENFDEYLKQMESSQKSTATMRALKENWENGRMSFSIKDSRISSHICNTPSDLRKYLTVQGEQSIELDLPSSHPAILARIFQPSESSNQEEIEQHALLVKLIQRGLFYEAFEHCWLQDRRVFLRWAVPKRKFSDPMKFKQAKQDYLSMAPRKGVKLIWQIIINTNRWFYESKIADELEQALPYFTKRLSGYKKRRGAGLGCELRKREADIINSIAIALDAPCATIYDGILCARRNADEVIRLTQKATAENLGFEMTPVVKLDAPIEAIQPKKNNGQTMPHTSQSALPF